MKRANIIFHTFLLLAIASLFTMCRKELASDYTYTELPTLIIDTTGTQINFTIKQNSEELAISPKVVYTGDNTLDYYWIRSNRNLTGYPIGDDTLSREKDLRTTLDLPISNASNYDGAYSFYFIVKERETGNMEFVEYLVHVTGAFGRGLFAVHEKDGMADFSLIETPTGAASPVYYNIHQTVNGGALPGKAAGIGATGTSSFVVFMTDQAAIMMSYDGLKLRFSDMEIFGALSPDVLRPEAYGFYGGTQCYIVNNGKVYTNGNASNVGGGLMLSRMAMQDGSDYRMAPIYLRPYAYGGLFFDELQGRMVQCAPGNFPTGVTTFDPVIPADPGRRFSLHNIDRKLVAMRRSFNLSSNWAHSTVYAVFEDKGNSLSKYLYVMNVDNPQQPDYALINLSNMQDMDQALHFETITSSPVLYYATSQKIYLLQVNAPGNNAVQAGVQFTAPEGEEITKLFSDNTSRCYVATYEPATGKSKVYLMAVNNGNGYMNSAPAKVWTDFEGKITLLDLKRY